MPIAMRFSPFRDRASSSPLMARLTVLPDSPSHGLPRPSVRCHAKTLKGSLLSERSLLATRREEEEKSAAAAAAAAADAADGESPSGFSSCRSAPPTGSVLPFDGSMTGGNKAGKGKRAAEEFTVIDPVLGEFAVKALIDRLRKKPQIHPDELEEYVAIPEEYEDDRPEVMRKIRGLHTVYWKNAHTRRRLLDLMLDDREFSSEGDFLREKLLVYKQETLILHEEIRALEGPLYPIPEVFARPVALLE